MNTEQNKVILIVDDDLETLETYTELFKQHGFEVIQAHDGVEGLDIATSKEGIDVIFTGIIMPRMDGFQFIEALKGNSVSANMPIVMNSHLGREEDRKKALALGVKDFIIRGLIPPSEVVKRVIRSFSVEDREYMLKVDTLEYDGQIFLQDLALPENFMCDNCGTALGIILSRGEGGKFVAKVSCPNCKKEYI